MKQITTAFCVLAITMGCVAPAPEQGSGGHITNANPRPESCEWYHPPPPPLPDGTPNHTAVRLTLDGTEPQQLSVRVTAPDGSSKEARLGEGAGCEPKRSADGLVVTCADATWHIVGKPEQVVVLRDQSSIATFDVDPGKALAFEVERL